MFRDGEVLGEIQVSAKKKYVFSKLYVDKNGETKEYVKIHEFFLGKDNAWHPAKKVTTWEGKPIVALSFAIAYDKITAWISILEAAKSLNTQAPTTTNTDNIVDPF